MYGILISGNDVFLIKQDDSVDAPWRMVAEFDGDVEDAKLVAIETRDRLNEAR